MYLIRSKNLEKKNFNNEFTKTFRNDYLHCKSPLIFFLIFLREINDSQHL